jgi:enediyne polyketide synthase
VTVACDFEEAAGRPEELWRDLLGPTRSALAGRLATEAGESFDAGAARVWAATECIRKAGRPAGEPLVLGESSVDGWTLLRAGQAPIATYVGGIAGVNDPVAFAFLVGGAP